MRPTARVALLTIVIGSLVGSARGQNLLANGGFQTSLVPWLSLATFETAVWQPLDANGSPSSGSAKLTNASPLPFSSGGGSLLQCVPITGGASYDFGAKVQIPSGQANAGFVQLQLAWYSAPGCDGFLSTRGTNAEGVTDVWQSTGLAAVAAPGGAVSANVSLAHFKNEGGGSFVTYFDDAYLRPAVAPTGLLTLPSVTSVHGANDTFFHSDVWILNRSFTNAQDITLRYRCFTGLPCAFPEGQVVNLPSRGSRLFSDIVFSRFGSPETAGALEIGWNASLGQLTASSRLYTPSLPEPTSGFSLPGVPPAEARTNAVFIGLGGSGGDLSQGFRTNAGAYNPNASSVTVTFTLHAASGAVLGSPHSRTLGPNEPIQINNIFSVVGAPSTVATDAYLVVSTNGPPVFAFAAVIDNKSGDSVWVIPSDDGGVGPATGLLTLPSITSVHGANQTFFHSDVWILNRSSSNAQNITLRYRCFAGLTCSASPQVVNLQPRASRLFSDIVGSTFASPETAGALEIGYNAALGQLTASSRLYTPSLPSPTSGFSFPGVPSTAARTRAVFIGLGGSGGDLSQGFRTNAGAYNPNASAVTVTFTLHAASGAVLGAPHSRILGPNEPIQINNIFSVVGATSTVATDAYLVVSTNGLPVFPFVAVIDNKSGDSVWVIPSDDEAL